ncbi:MAG: hypothetical protein ACP5J4_20510 [Anaerolineae bacterium]
MKKVYIGLCMLMVLLWTGCTSREPGITSPTTKTTPVVVVPTLTPEWLVAIPGITEPTTNSPCQGAQWTGLTFRETTEVELVEWLKTSAMVNQDSLVDAWYEPYNAPRIHYYSWLIQSGSLGRGVFNVLTDTVYSFYAPVMYPLDLERMVDLWGKPEYVAAYMEVRSKEDCTYTYEMGYPALGLMVSGLFEPADARCEMLEEDAVTGKRYGPWQSSYPVTHISCGASDNLEALIENVYVTDDPETVTHISRRFRPWPGWGRIELFKE